MSLGSAAHTVTIELPNGFLPEIAGTIEGFAAELRLAAAIEWYREGRVSQGRGAEVAGLTRAGFLEALHRAEVSASQVGVAELMEEVDRAAAPDRRRVAVDLAHQGGAPGPPPAG